ncbi:hypothetical protein PCANB_001350 [Pneumocystis canis]|nr:hypothetical protein PCANB_001350 [Pneumocystis canis]
MKEISQKEEILEVIPKITMNPPHIKDLENSQKFKKYSGGLDKILQSFDNLHEWADYISFLSKLLKTLHAYPTFSVIPYQDLVAFRLAQCLNPNLPSGVHQKTLEKNGLADSLPLWTSGLVPILMFASTKIKPYFLGLIETFYLPLGTSLRPCIKSLIMSLLPGLEEESGEYFDEVFSVLDSIRQKLADEIFFWQCFWLCIITSPQQRQGALKYLFKRLPVLKEKSDHIFLIMQPDSGLFIRAFSSGLSDEQLLVCREFLELLVQNLPLSLIVSQENISLLDIELLVMSAIRVILRKEISLNRRVWSWLMGSDLHQDLCEGSYFRNYGMKYVISSIKNYLDINKNDSLKLGEIFEILLFLMDKPNIGNIVIPDIFLLAIRTIYLFSESCYDDLYNNALSCARAFLNSLDLKLIWGKILSLVDEQYEFDISDYKLALYIISNFNVHEDAVFFHIPMILYIIVSNIFEKSENMAVEKELLLLAYKLISFIPNSNLPGIILDEYNSHDRIFLKDSIEKYYQDSLVVWNDMDLSKEMIMDSIFYLLIENIERYLDSFYLFEILQLTYEFVPKALRCLKVQKAKILDVIASVLGSGKLDFNHIYFIVKIIVELLKRAWINAEDINNDNLLVPLVFYIWDCFSPGNSKYHIDASRLLWTLHKMLGGSFIETIIMYAMNIRESAHIVCFKFSILWKYSVPKVDESLFDHVLSRPSLMMIGFLHSSDIHAKLLVKFWIETLNNSFVRLLDIIITKLLSLDLIRPPKNEIIQELEVSLLRFKETDDISMLVYYVSVCVEVIEFGGINLLDHAFTELLNVDTNKSNLLSKYCLVSSDMTYIGILAKIAIRVLHMVSESDSGNAESIINLHFLASKLLFYIVSKCSLFDHELIHVLLIRLTIKDLFFEHILDKYILDVLYIIFKRNINQYETDFKEFFLTTIQSLSVEDILKDKFQKPVPRNWLFMLIRFFIIRLSGTQIPSNVEILIDFYKRCLGLFTNQMFHIFIPFIEVLCSRINSIITGFMTDFSGFKTDGLFSYEIILYCLEGLQYTITWAFENHEHKSKNFSLKSSENAGFFGNVMSGMFSLEAPSIVTLSVDSLNSIILCFQEIVKLAFYVWSWLEFNTIVVNIERLETYKFINMWLKTASRQLLYLLYDSKPIETLESLINSINKSDTKIKEHIFYFLSKFDDSRKYEIIPFLIDSIHSRINSTFVTGKYKSSLVISVTPNLIINFLINFVEFSETNFLKQNWPVCLSFFRNVVSNPQQYQIIDTYILHFATSLIRKLSEINLEKRNKKEMIVILFTSKLSKSYDSGLSPSRDTNSQARIDNYDDIEEKIDVSDKIDKLDKNDQSFTSSLFLSYELNHVLFKYVIPSLSIIIIDNEKIAYACSMITACVIGSEHRNSQIPRRYSEDTLVLLAKLAELPSSFKFWRKEIMDIFNDSSFFMIPLTEAILWMPIIKQLYNNDKDKSLEILNKIPFYSSSGIFVFRESEVSSRKYQLKRLIFIIISSDKDKYADKIKDIENVILEYTKGPLRKTLRKEIFLLIRTLIVYMSSVHLTSLWAIILLELQHCFKDLLEKDLPWSQELLDLLLDACKLLDVILVIEPDEFLMHKWIFIPDIVNSSHLSDNCKSIALVDKLFHKIFSFFHDSMCTNGISNPSQGFLNMNLHNKRSPIIISKIIHDVSDIVPFLSCISEINYKRMYDSCFPDIESCKMGVLRDLF